MHLLHRVVKLPNFKLKTRPKQLLVSLSQTFALSEQSELCCVTLESRTKYSLSHSREHFRNIFQM